MNTPHKEQILRHPAPVQPAKQPAPSREQIRRELGWNFNFVKGGGQSPR